MNDTKLKSSIFNEDSQNFNKNSLDIYSCSVNNDSLFSHQNHTQLSSQDTCPISKSMYTKYTPDLENTCVTEAENFCSTLNIDEATLSNSLVQVNKHNLQCELINENDISSTKTDCVYFKPIIKAGAIIGLTLLGKEFLSYCYDSVKKRFNYVKEVFVSWYKTNCQKEKQLNQDEKRLEESENKTVLPENSEQCLVQESSSLYELSQNLRMNKKTELVEQPVDIYTNNRFSSLSQTQTQKEIEKPNYLKQLENLINSNEYNNKNEFEKISILEKELTSYKEASISNEELLQVKNYIWELLKSTTEINGKSKPMFRNATNTNLYKIVNPDFQKIDPVSTNIESNPNEVRMVELNLTNIYHVESTPDNGIQNQYSAEPEVKEEDNLLYDTIITSAEYNKNLKKLRQTVAKHNNIEDIITLMQATIKLIINNFNNDDYDNDNFNNLLSNKYKEIFPNSAISQDDLKKINLVINAIKTFYKSKRNSKQIKTLKNDLFSLAAINDKNLRYGFSLAIQEIFKNTLTPDLYANFATIINQNTPNLLIGKLGTETVFNPTDLSNSEYNRFIAKFEVGKKLQQENEEELQQENEEEIRVQDKKIKESKAPNIESNPYGVKMFEVVLANIHSIRETKDLQQNEQLDEVTEEHAKGEDDLDYLTSDKIATKKTLKEKREDESIINIEEDYIEPEEDDNEAKEDDNEAKEERKEPEEDDNEAEEDDNEAEEERKKPENNFIQNSIKGTNDKIATDEAILDLLLERNVSLDRNVSFTNSIQTSQVESVADSCIANIQKLGSKSQEDSLTKEEYNELENYKNIIILSFLSKQKQFETLNMNSSNKKMLPLTYKKEHKKLVSSLPSNNNNYIVDNNIIIKQDQNALYTYINNITNEVMNLAQKGQLNTEEIAILNDFKDTLKNHIITKDEGLKEIITQTISNINKIINTELDREDNIKATVVNQKTEEEDYKKYKLDRLDEEADEAVMFNQSQADQKGMVRAVVQNIKNKMPNQDKLKKYTSISDLVRDIQGLDSDTIMQQLDIIVKEVNNKINLLSSSRQDINKSQKIIAILQTTEQNLKTILKTVSEKKLSDKAIITITKACAACNFNKNNTKNIIVNTDNAGNATNVKNFPVSFKSDKSVTLGLDMKTSNDQILENGNRTFKAEILNTSSEEFNNYTKDKNICLNFTFSPKIDMITFIKNSRSIGFCKGYDLTMDNNSKPTSSIDKCKKMEELLKNLSEIIKISEDDKPRKLIEFLKVNPKDREFIETFEKELMTNLATEYEITPKKITKLEDLTQIIFQIQKMEEAKTKTKTKTKEQLLEEQRQFEVTQKALEDLEDLEVENRLIF